MHRRPGMIPVGSCLFGLVVSIVGLLYITGSVYGLRHVPFLMFGLLFIMMWSLVLMTIIRASGRD